MIDQTIKRIEINNFLFGNHSNYFDTLNFITSSNNISEKKNVFVFRNQSFETIATILKNIALNFSTELKFNYSDYINFFDLDGINFNEYDIVIFWIDYSFCSNKKTFEYFVDHLASCINTIQDNFNCKIILNTADENTQLYSEINLLLKNEIKTEHLLNINILSPDEHFDVNRKNITGTLFNKDGLAILAKELVVKQLHGLLFDRIKCVVIDLDNTFYTGVLGEVSDFSEIVIEKHHYKFQSLLKKLNNAGIFISISSKNHYQDVENFFQEREDLQIQFNDFIFPQINWNSKSSNISKIADQLNIGLEAILFIDDNIGEISEVIDSYPEINVLMAQTDNENNSIDILTSNFPFSLNNLNETDQLRINDSRLNIKRSELHSKHTSDKDFFESLSMTLKIHLNFKQHIQRVSQLSNKTNQFTLCLNRFSEKDIERFISKKNTEVFTFELKDRLSDSGIIGFFICDINDNKVSIIEINLSCRALGRRVEKYLFSSIINHLIATHEVDEFTLNLKHGPRNDPAINFFNVFFDEIFNEIKYGDDYLICSKIIPEILVNYINQDLVFFES